MDTHTPTLGIRSAGAHSAEHYFKTRGSTLIDWLRAERESGHAPDRIAGHLEALTDGLIVISARTISRWLERIDEAA